MKRLSVLAAAILSFGILTASADNDIPITFEQLPKTAQTFITSHFPKHKVAYAKEERDLMKVSYDVMFTDGTKLEFDKNGDWKEVDTKPAAVPSAQVQASPSQQAEADPALRSPSEYLSQSCPNY